MSIERVYRNSRSLLAEAFSESVVRRIYRTINNAGGQAYLTGGYVRDKLISGQPDPDDADFIVVGMEMDEIADVLQKEFGDAFQHGEVVGKHFGILRPAIFGTVYDIALPRVETSTGSKKKDFDVQYGGRLSLKDDLKRRDFTFNAMALDAEGNIVDYFNGKKDLQNGIVRAVGEPLQRFVEDPTRILRAIRFAVRFGFRIEPKTAKAIRENLGLLKNVEKEMIFKELTKAWMQSMESSNSGIIKLMKGLGIGEFLFGPSFKPIPLEFTGNKTERKFANFIAFFLTGGDMNRMAVESECVRWLQRAKSVIENPQTNKYDKEEIKFLQRVFSGLKGFEKLATILEKRLAHPVNRKDLAIDGAEIQRILGLKSGAEVGAAIELVLKAVQQGVTENDKESLKDFLFFYTHEPNLKNGIR